MIFDESSRVVPSRPEGTPGQLSRPRPLRTGQLDDSRDGFLSRVVPAAKDSPTAAAPWRLGRGRHLFWPSRTRPPTELASVLLSPAGALRNAPQRTDGRGAARTPKRPQEAIVSDSRVIRSADRTGVRSSDVRAREEAARLAQREHRATRQITDTLRPDGTRLVIETERTRRGPRIVLRTVTGAEGRQRGSMCVHARELDALEQAIAAVREMGGEA